MMDPQPTNQAEYKELGVRNPKLGADLYLISDKLEAIRKSLAAWIAYKGPSLGLPKKEPLSNEPHGWHPRLQFECGDAAVLLDKDHKPVGLRFNQPNRLNPDVIPGEIWDVDMRGRVADIPPKK